MSNKELNDFESFIESIESFLTDRHDLELVYKNKCDYNSFYYTLLAKDKNGKIIVRFELRLRISNHDVKRIKAQQHNRSEEDRIVREELEKRKIPAFALHKMNKIQLNFVVNNESYHSYGSAFNDIINEIDEYLDN